jgi:hypothetical protein
VMQYRFIDSRGTSYSEATENRVLLWFPDEATAEQAWTALSQIVRVRRTQAETTVQ